MLKNVTKDKLQLNHSLNYAYQGYLLFAFLTIHLNYNIIDAKGNIFIIILL
jgi:hypothetical protein